MVVLDQKLSNNMRTLSTATSKLIVTNLFFARHVSSFSMTSSDSTITISISSAGSNPLVNGIYHPKSPTTVPAGFDRTCRVMNWDTDSMWKQLSDRQRPWYEAENESYIYWNRGDGKWWIDAPSGDGVYIVEDSGIVPPEGGWVSLSGDDDAAPIVNVLEREL